MRNGEELSGGKNDTERYLETSPNRKELRINYCLLYQ